MSNHYLILVKILKKLQKRISKKKIKKISDRLTTTNISIRRCKRSQRPLVYQWLVSVDHHLQRSRIMKTQMFSNTINRQLKYK